MFNSKSDKAEEFINNEEILATMAFAQKQVNDKKVLAAILEKAKSLVGLNYKEVAILLYACENEENQSMREDIFRLAREIKEKIYGRRIVMFAPLYVSNYCINGCSYCGYHCGSGILRKRLTMDEITEEVKAMEQMGHKRIVIEAGEDEKNCPIEYVLDCIKTAYEAKKDNGEIRRININIAATTVENYSKLKNSGIGTYILFQETYNKETYEKLHKFGPKADYEYHTTAHDRAMEGGIDDVGIGALYGLYEYKYEVIATMLHVAHLEAKFGVGPHTISVPRLRAAEGTDLSDYPNIVSDEQFKNIIAVLRIAVPYTGMIISTREEQNFRDEIISLGISQASGGSCTGIGGYSQKEECSCENTAQFTVSDERSQAEVAKALLKNGYIPSFCTACYREGRTGDRFMQLAKAGQICNVCQPNALLTLLEYSIDYGDEEFQKLVDEVIEKETEQISNEIIKTKTKEYFEKIRSGQRDFRF